MSLGIKRYASALHAVDVVVGNSSSALIEAPSLGKCAVNIGDRQKGRLRAESVLDCACETNAILAALDHAFAMPSPAPNGLFGVPAQVCPSIAQKLIELTVPPDLKKAFHDK